MGNIQIQNTIGISYMLKSFKDQDSNPNYYHEALELAYNLKSVKELRTLGSF